MYKHDACFKVVSILHNSAGKRIGYFHREDETNENKLVFSVYQNQLMINSPLPQHVHLTVTNISGETVLNKIVFVNSVETRIPLQQPGEGI